jgi:hypothetical protein
MEQRISIYIDPQRVFCFAHGAGTFDKQSIFEPGEPQCANAFDFFNGGCAQRNGPRVGDTEAVILGLMPGAARHEPDVG